jgi:hypothetical protein
VYLTNQARRDLLGKYDYTNRKAIEARIDKALRKAKGRRYFTYTLSGTDEAQDWQLHWEKVQDAITQSGRFDGIALLCTNVPVERVASRCSDVRKAGR